MTLVAPIVMVSINIYSYIDEFVNTRIHAKRNFLVGYAEEGSPQYCFIFAISLKTRTTISYFSSSGHNNTTFWP